MLCFVYLQAVAFYVPAQPVAVPSETEPGRYGVTFQYKHNTGQPTPRSVNLAGDFNSWSTTATQMRITTGSEYKARLVLPQGEYLYKLILNGNEWKQDENNPHSRADEFGGRNSVIAVGVEPTSQDHQIDYPPSIRAEPTGAGKYRVTFTYSDPKASRVFLAGNFNHWNPGKDAMAEKVNGSFSITVELEEGIVPYKFVVDGKWTRDPQNPDGFDDNNSGLNSILRLGAAAQVRISDQQVGDDSVAIDGLVHDPESILFLNPKQDGNVVVKLQAMANDLQGAQLAGTTSAPYGMTSEFEDERVEIFRAKVPVKAIAHETSSPEDGLRATYTLSVVDGKTSVGFGSDGATTASADGQIFLNKFTRKIKNEDIFATPDWAREVVWYQVFPERFRNGSADNDPVSSGVTLRKWTSDWWERSENETDRALEPGVFGRRYGGDIQGMIEKLSYLKELGVGAVYLNPVFEAESLHKYEATDYRHIDDNFGFAGDYASAVASEDLLLSSTWTFTKSDRLFLDFLEKAHATGIRVIIDGVFNHTGTEHPAFVDLQKHGRNSRFADWYSVTSWDPFVHEGWAGFKGLPEFKEDESGFVSDSLKQHLLDITTRWMDPNGDGNPSDGVDGWRLDVPNEVSSEWWREWRAHVKAINPQAIIIAEIWDPAAKWLQGDQFDSVMNYQLAQALTRFFTNTGKATELKQDLAKLLSSVPDQSSYVMMNLMDSHDTDRLVSQLNNPGRGYDARNRQQELQPGEYSSSKPAAEVYKRMMQLTAVQFSLVGAPMIYYGNEAGMWGADDPEDRKPMLWKDLEPYDKPEENHFMEDVHAHYQRCAAIRNTLPALQHGTYETLLADDERRLFAFKRSFADQSVVVMTNDTKHQQDVIIQINSETVEHRHTYINLLDDPAVKVVHANANGVTKAVIQFDGAKELRSIKGSITVALPANTTAILLQTK